MPRASTSTAVRVCTACAAAGLPARRLQLLQRERVTASVGVAGVRLLSSVVAVLLKATCRLAYVFVAWPRAVNS